MQIRVWLSADGYRDPDDNLAMLLGAAQARVTAKSGNDVRVAGAVFGDTKDGGQYYTLNPAGTAPVAFGSDSRYGSVGGNQQAAGNYAFYKQYARRGAQGTRPGLGQVRPARRGPGRHALLELRRRPRVADQHGLPRARRRHPRGDRQDRGAATAAEVVVYSAGGGANVAAEAIGYLLNQGYSEAVLLKHFAVVQHGNNWVTNYEAAARILTRDFTVAISNQNYETYLNGMDGPYLKQALSGPTSETAFGVAFDKALAVATGATAFQNLGAGKTFKKTLDASDAGSHAFAVDVDRLAAALDNRLSGTEEMQTGFDWAHLIDQGGSTRLREVYGAFDAAAIARLLGTGQTARVAALESGDSGTGSVTGSATVTAAVAASRDDAESYGGVASDDLDLGETTTAAGKVANDVALRFTGLALDAGAEIESAYLLFEAKRSGDAGGTLAIAVADDLGRRFSPGEDLAARDWHDETVAWTPGAWKAGEAYRSADVSDLVAAAIEGGGPDALDALAFRITGTGSHSAHASGLGRDGPGPRHRPGLTSTAPAGAAGMTALPRLPVGLPALARPARRGVDRGARGGYPRRPVCLTSIVGGPCVTQDRVQRFPRTAISSSSAR